MIKVGINNWVIDMDNLGYTVGKLVERESINKKTGEKKIVKSIDNARYPCGLKECFERILKVENANSLGGNELHDLKYALEVIEKNYQMVNDAFHRALKEKL